MSTAPDAGLKFFTVKEIAGSLLLCESVQGIGYGEVVRVIAQDGDEKGDAARPVPTIARRWWFFANEQPCCVGVGLRLLCCSSSRFFPGLGREVQADDDVIRDHVTELRES